MLCLLTFEISEDRDGKNFYTGVHGILVLLLFKSRQTVGVRVKNFKSFLGILEMQNSLFPPTMARSLILSDL